jgi:uncharacterized lipoprotein YehR (DUF1307 family)
MNNPFKIFRRVEGLLKQVQELKEEVRSLHYKKSKLEEVLELKFKAVDILSNKSLSGFEAWAMNDKRIPDAIARLADSLLKETK